MITATSRYAQGTLVRMPDENGVYRLAVLRTVPPATAAFTLYIWQVGNRPDIVANTLLGDPSLWWAIFDINPELIDPLNVPPGTAVRIPIAPVNGQGTTLQ